MCDLFDPSGEPQVDIAGITGQPDERWMQQMARNVTMEGWGTLRDCRYLLHDRDTKYTHSFEAIIELGHVQPLVLPARSPNLNAYAERWMRGSVLKPPWSRQRPLRSALHMHAVCRLVRAPHMILLRIYASRHLSQSVVAFRPP